MCIDWDNDGLTIQYFYFIIFSYIRKNAFYLGETSLKLAARNGYTNIVKTLLENGADVNLQNKYG